MIKIAANKTVLLFLLLCLIHLFAIIVPFSWLRAVSKPLLMPALLLVLIKASTGMKGRKFIIAGLFFAWLGDIFLLLERVNALFFITGLASFLITHTCYIIYFLSIKSANPSLLIKNPVLIWLVLFYGAALVAILFPFLGPLKIPVLVYSIIICSMLLASLHVYFKISAPANLYFVAGALLFVGSDSILAINKFYRPFALGSFWVMASYCAAQYLVVLGFINNRQRTLLPDHQGFNP